jgi:HAD superfamily hydrolase (TIGR01490 family)
MMSVARSRPAAILDLDRTLIDVDAGFRFAQHMVAGDRAAIQAAGGRERRALRRRLRLRMAETYAKACVLLPLYRARVVSRSRLVRESYAFFRGYPVEEIRSVLAAFFEADLKHHVFPGVRELITWHEEHGHATAIITSAPNSIAQLFATHLGVQHAAGVRLEQVEGRLTGRVKEGPLWGLDKLHHAERLAAEHGWDLAASFAYSDHDSDVALLEAVGRPVAVHPNPRLVRIAARRGWPVLELTDASRVRAALDSLAS